MDQDRKEYLDELWDTAKNDFGIQQIKEEWDWMIAKTVNTWVQHQNILEIGCYDGGSTSYLSHFADDMITIDNNTPARFDVKEVNPNVKGLYKYVGGDSHSGVTLSHLDGMTFDFAFIDGDHSWEGVKADFYNVLPYLTKGSPVVFHVIVISDFHHQHGCYVGEFWEELKRDFKGGTFSELKTDENWAGIGIVILD
jgi:predicted O-methyltransferase YrrM